MAREIGPMRHPGNGLAETEVEANALGPESVTGEEANPELLPQREPFRTAFHTIGLIEQAIGTLLLVAILFLVLTQVAQRYIPGQGWPWTGEVARYSMVWVAFVLSGYLVAHDRHIAIHLVDYVLSGRGLALIKLLVNAVILVTCLGMMYATYDLIASDIGQVTAAAELPLKWVNVPVLIGFALSATRAALAIVVADLPALLNGEGARS